MNRQPSIAKRRVDERRPGFSSYYRIGVRMSKELPTYCTLRQIGSELGISYQNAYTECAVALGKLIFRLRAAMPERSNSHTTGESK